MSRLVVHGGDLVTRDGLLPGDVVVEGGRIAEVRRGAPPRAPGQRDDEEVLDASGLVVAPGFIDLQCNGAAGVDLTSEPERLWEVAAALPRWGVTSWLPTIVTSPPGTVERALAALHAGPPPELRDGPHAVPLAVPLGLHVEGPYLAPDRRGAHAEGLLRAPDAEEVEGWSRDAGVALVTLAPELPGADALIRDLVERDVVVSAGHSDATAEEAEAAVDAGVRWVTHLFNAMAPLHHRAPGLAGVALADDRLRAGVIADGVHLHPATVVAAHRALGDRLTLVTDATAVVGAPPGGAVLGGSPVDIGDAGDVRLPDGTLAGSALSMDRAVRNLATWTGCGPAVAVRAATATPAAVLDRRDVGVLRAGARADLVLLDRDLQVVTTLIGTSVVRFPR